LLGIGIDNNKKVTILQNIAEKLSRFCYNYIWVNAIQSPPDKVVIFSKTRKDMT